MGHESCNDAISTFIEALDNFLPFEKYGQYTNRTIPTVGTTISTCGVISKSSMKSMCSPVSSTQLLRRSVRQPSATTSLKRTKRALKELSHLLEEFTTWSMMMMLGTALGVLVVATDGPILAATNVAAIRTWIE
jgi:hypothetical protein